MNMTCEDGNFLACCFAYKLIQLTSGFEKFLFRFILFTFLFLVFSYGVNKTNVDDGTISESFNDESPYLVLLDFFIIII